MHIPTPFFAGVLGLGGPEVIIIFAIFMLLFGGAKLPDLAKGLGKSIKEFKQASREDPDPPQVAQPVAASPVSATLNPSAAEKKNAP